MEGSMDAGTGSAGGVVSTEAWRETIKFNAPDIHRAAFDGADELMASLAIRCVNEACFGSHSTALRRFRYVYDNGGFQPEDVAAALRQAESNYLGKLAEITEEENYHRIKGDIAEENVRMKMRKGIIRMNVVYVLCLITALAIASFYLDGKILALIAASIGGTVTHLLGERNKLLKEKPPGK